ncbi:major histocompatibility complex class I-related gene protein-like [Varanus komodoensis]|uniref:major histocompatibility complex class I-related gene protein-like n=1 Tax=Varanus komodoensis TaxID=61221 RepID=UPI001CF7BFAA|nr:major histocompatibility complex class I-related gene protein-like [Varanus komodoensis]
MSQPPDSGPPLLALEGCLSGAAFLRYDSLSGKARPRGAWAKTLEEAKPGHWDQQTELLLRILRFVGHLRAARSCWASSAGSLVWQEMFGCELSRDGHTQYHWHYACDGEENLTFNLEDLTWAAYGSAAEITKMLWEAKPSIAEEIKRFLVKTCIEQLKRYGSYANVTEPPVVTVSRKVNESVETLVCRVHGFYPREINATWRMNGMVQEHHTFAQVAPNADGTFYHRLSIDIDPQKRDQYRCHVNHMGLPETLAWEEPTATNTWIVVVVSIIFIFIIIIAVSMLWML